MHLVLVYIHEAHSSAWPRALAAEPEPHASMADRLARARAFVAAHPECPYPVLVDGWDDAFEQRYWAWPDKYVYVDADRRLLQKSTYGARRDALVDEDVIDLATRLIAA
mgnify:CR=1 FL=1